MSKYAALFVLLLASFTGLSTGAVAETPDWTPVCDLDERREIYWPAIDETVTLRSELTGDGVYSPRGRQTLIFSDGHELLLGEGGKYIDDFHPDYPAPGCAEYLAASNGAIVFSLTRVEGSRVSANVYIAPGFASVDELDVAWRVPADCATGQAPYTGLPCYTRKGLMENFTGRDDPRFQHLVAVKAPIIVVPYSTYAVSYLAFDPETRTLHWLYAEGC